MSRPNQQNNQQNRGQQQQGRSNGQGNGHNNNQQQQKQPLPTGLHECMGCGRRDYETPMVQVRRGPRICAHCITDAWHGLAALHEPVRYDAEPNLSFLRRA